MSCWTPEQDAELYRLYVQDGFSASQAGKVLRRSRNAIIGRAHRLGWRREKASAPVVKAPYPVRAAPKNVRRKQTPRPSFSASSFNAAGPVAPTKPARGAAILSPNAKPWMERAVAECAFPVDGHGADTRSCCNPAGLKTYCEAHESIMRAPTKKLNTHGVPLEKSRKPRDKQADPFFAGWAA